MACAVPFRKFSASEFRWERYSNAHGLIRVVADSFGESRQFSYFRLNDMDVFDGAVMAPLKKRSTSVGGLYKRCRVSPCFFLLVLFCTGAVRGRG